MRLAAEVGEGARDDQAEIPRHSRGAGKGVTA